MLIVSCLQGDDDQPGQAGGDGVGWLAVSKYGQHSSSSSCIAHIYTFVFLCMAEYLV